MVWNKHMKRKMYPNLILGIFIIDTISILPAYHILVPSRSPNVYSLSPSSTYARQFLKASTNHKLNPTRWDSSDASNSEFHPLQSKNPPKMDYSLLACGLSDVKDSLPSLTLIGKDGSRSLDGILNDFFQSYLFLLMMHELLGYVFLVDTQFYELSEHKVKKQIGNQLPIDEILPAEQGWFGVDVAKLQVDILRSFAPDAPFVIAALNLDRPNAMPIEELRAALGINKTVPIIPCETTHTASVHQVLFELLERHEDFYGKNAHADLAREIIQAYKGET